MASKKQLFTTPVGTVEPYAYLTKPDYGNEEKGFGNPRGIRKGSLTFKSDDPAIVKLIAQIQRTHNENYDALVANYEANPPVVARGKKPLLPYEGDMPFMDNGDGTVTLKFSAYASYIDPKTQKSMPINCNLFDSRGKRIEDAPAFIGGGSKCKFRFSMFPYGFSNVAGASVKLQLDSVMIVELATSGGAADEDSWGDEAVEGGYVANSKPRQEEQSWTPEDESQFNAQNEEQDDDF